MALGLFKRKETPKETAWNEDLAEFVNKEYTRRQTERKPFELSWRLTSEFINGNQFLDINPVSQTIEEVPKIFWHQEREVFNQLSTIVETRIARLTRQMPMHKVRPASSGDDDIASSKISSMLLTSAWHEQDMNMGYGDFVAWLEFAGTAHWKASWSMQKGRIIGQMPSEPAASQPVQQPADTPNAILEQPDPVKAAEPNPFVQQAQMVEIREGDIETCVVPAHEFYPDSCYRNDLRSCRSIIHARAYHIDEIEEVWGQRVEPEEVDVMTLQMTGVGSGGIGYQVGSYRGGTSKLKGHAVVKEYYERPTKKYPFGRFIVVAGDKTLHAGPMPYVLGANHEVDFPFIRCVSIDRPGYYFGATVAERCIPVQRRYNALRNRKAEYLNLVAIGQWYEPEGSVDDDTELNNAPGNRIKYRPGMNGAKPEPVTWPSLPNSFEMEEHSLLAEFTAISGVSELSRFSEAPSGVKSGVALSQAAEQDDTRIATTAQNIGDSVVLLGKYWLRLYRQYVQEPRLLRSVGRNRDVEVREWLASDLRSDDVILENATALSETPSQRRQMVFDLLNAGLFNRAELSNLSEEGRNKVFQMLEYGHWESEAEDMYWLQRNRAHRENKNIMQGMPMPVMDFDDHVIHIEQHNRQRMQAEYDQLLMTPIGQMVDQIMREHLGQHQMIVAQMQAEQMAQEAAMQEQTKGGPPPKQ